MKSVRIRNFSGSHFPAFGLKMEMWENTDKNNYKYGNFSRSVSYILQLSHENEATDKEKSEKL